MFYTLQKVKCRQRDWAIYNYRLCCCQPLGCRPAGDIGISPFMSIMFWCLPCVDVRVSEYTHLLPLLVVKYWVTSSFVASVIHPKPATVLEASLQTGGQNSKLCLYDSTCELHICNSGGIFIIVQDFGDSSHIFQPGRKRTLWTKFTET